MPDFPKVSGREVWRIDTLCIWCRGPVWPEGEYFKVGEHLFHPECLQQLLSLSGEELEEALRRLPLDVRLALQGGDPPGERGGRLRELARRAVDAALRKAGVERVWQMRADGMHAEPYGEFLKALKEELEKLAVPGARLEFQTSFHGRGYGDTSVYLQGELWGVWRPQYTTTIVSSFWMWVDRVENLLREMHRRGLLRREVL